MLRSYRSLILAIGLTLTGTNHAYAEEVDQKYRTQQSITQSLSDIATTNRQGEERAQRSDQDEAPCGQRKYGSNADLCAQWKAADAAAVSAWWAWVSGVGVLLALGIASHSNWIARDTARRQLRAYLHVTKYTVDVTTKPHSPWVKICVENCGQTPAMDVRIDMRVFYIDLDNPPKIESRDFAKIPPSASIGPGGRLWTDRAWMGAERPLFVDPKNALCAFAEIRYLDVFRREHFTRFCVTGFGMIPDSLDVRLHSRYNDSD